VRVRVKIEILNFLNFEIFAYRSVCFFVCLSVVFFVLDDGGLDFGDCSRTVLAFKPAVNDVDETLS
jgi:hypothetical protein